MKYRMFLLSLACFAASCIAIQINRDLLEVRTEEFHLEYGSELSFQNTNGDMEVKEWDSEFVQVESFVYGDSGIGVPENLEIRFEEMEEGLSAVVDYPGGVSFCSVDFVVSIPHSMGMSILNSTTNGDTFISADVFANVESVNGDIFVEALSSSGLAAVNGDISALLKEQSTSMEIQTVNGDISVEIPELLRISVETVNGEITAGEGSVEDILNIDGTETVAIETVNGDIALKRITVR